MQKTGENTESKTYVVAYVMLSDTKITDSSL